MSSDEDKLLLLVFVACLLRKTSEERVRDTSEVHLARRHSYWGKYVILRKSFNLSLIFRWIIVQWNIHLFYSIRWFVWAVETKILCWICNIFFITFLIHLFSLRDESGSSFINRYWDVLKLWNYFNNFFRKRVLFRFQLCFNKTFQTSQFSL